MIIPAAYCLCACHAIRVATTLVLTWGPWTRIWLLLLVHPENQHKEECGFLCLILGCTGRGLAGGPRSCNLKALSGLGGPGQSRLNAASPLRFVTLRASELWAKFHPSHDPNIRFAETV
eukprot:3169387-Rhodomonas_salina.1